MFFKNKHDCQDVLLPLEVVIDCGLEVLSFALTKANLIPFKSLDASTKSTFNP
jgi:hypothetical protein